ncbi:MAG: HmuY family protein [Bacteroidota bacterium]
MKNQAIGYIYCLVCLLSLSACLREEIPIQPFDRGDAVIASVSMQANYQDQVWYDLGTNQIISTNAKTDWEIGLLCADSIWGIRLNSSLAMQAAATGSEDFEAINTSSGFHFRPDHPSGNIDSLALAGWELDQVYVLDLGYTPSGQQRGFRKIVLRSSENETYQIQYAKLDGTDEKSISITKDEQYNFMGYSLSEHEIRLVEPPKDQYDLCFTQYMHIFYDPYLPYLVTGVLTNPNRTQVALDSIAEFVEIEALDADRLVWSDAQDAIGYAWKYYDLQASSFTVFPKQVFMIRDHEGFLYKLHFLDFYDDLGNKGTPNFAFQRL